MRPQPLIAVRDVESVVVVGISGCSAAKAPMAAGNTSAGRRTRSLILQLHKWEVEHDHGPIGDPGTAHGNGVLLWFEIDDFEDAVARAQALQAEVVMPRHRNPADGDGGPNHWEIWLRDRDGYTVVLASPDGSADGSWKP